MGDLIVKKEGWTERLRFDQAENRFTLHLDADIEPVIDKNKRMANMNDGYSSKREWRRIATIPLVVIELWKNTYGVNPLSRGNEKLLRRLLNDPDLRGLRTSPGRF